MPPISDTIFSLARDIEWALYSGEWQPPYAALVYRPERRVLPCMDVGYERLEESRGYGSVERM